MKICYLQDAVFPWSKGGAEKRLFEIAKRMAKKGHEVHVCGAFPRLSCSGRLRTVGNKSCYGVYYHDVMAYDSLFAGERRSLWQALKFSFGVAKHLWKNNYDMIECFQSPIVHVPVAWLLKGKAKLAASWFEVWDKDYWVKYAGPVTGRVGAFLEWLCLRLPDVLVVPSIQTMIDVMKVNPNIGMHVVHNGINFNRIRKVKPSKERYDIIDVCRLIRGKRVDLLLEACHALRGNFPKLKVCIVGYGPERKNLENLAKACGVDVTFKGRIESDDEVYSLIKSSKLFVLPSVQEGGSSIVSLESAACGVPFITISSSLGISKEYVSGYIAKDLKDMVRMIIVLLKDAELRGRMGKAAIAFAKRFDWTNGMKDYERVFIC